METKMTKFDKLIIGVCIGLLVFLAFTIGIRFLTRQILIKYWGIDNTFTKIVWFDNPNLRACEEDEINTEGWSLSLNWEKLYPFDESKSNLNINENISQEQDNKNDDKLKRGITFITEAVTDVEGKIETYTSDLLIFYSDIVADASAYNQCIGWNIAPYDEYNSVIALSDGYLSTYVEKLDTSQQSEALVELNEFCKKSNIDFLYIQAPFKISEYEDIDVSGSLDYSNQNADDLLTQIDIAGVDYYDIRETIRQENINNHSLFYKTDHHWTTTTGLWAAQNILSYCNENYGWNADLSLLDVDQFDYVTYEGWFLGSQGKKITLERCEPDDFTLFYPKYETSFRYYIPDEEVDVIGDYSVVYDMSEIEKCDYYNMNPYGACNYGDHPLIKIINQISSEEHKILMIHDSFGDCVISCLALAEKNVDSLDVRYFTGSVKTYIEENTPDLVIVMYNAGGVGGEINYSTHKDKFDFR